MSGNLNAEQVRAAVTATHAATILSALGSLGDVFAEAGQDEEALKSALGGAFKERCLRFVDPGGVEAGGASQRFLDEGFLVGGAPILAFKMDGCSLGRYLVSGRFRVDWLASKQHLQINGYDLEFTVPGQGDAEDRIVLRLPLCWHFWHDTTAWGISTLWMAKFEGAQTGALLLSGATKPAAEPKVRCIKAGGLLEVKENQLKVTTDGLEIRRGAGAPHIGSITIELPPTKEDTPGTVQVIYGSEACDVDHLEVVTDGEVAFMTHDELEALLKSYAAAAAGTLEP